MTDSKSLRGKIVSARKEMGNPKLDSVGHAGRGGSREYKYASLAAILEVVEPPLLEVGCMVTQFMEDDAVVTKVLDADDEIVMDRRKVKVTLNPQDDGSAETYAKRYALMSVFGLSGVEDDDGAIARDSTASAPQGVQERPLPTSPDWSRWYAAKAEAVAAGVPESQVVGRLRAFGKDPDAFTQDEIDQCVSWTRSLVSGGA